MGAAVFPPFADQWRQICQVGMKNSDNKKAFNNAKMVHAYYLTKIFHPTLINLAPWLQKKTSF